MLRILVVEDEPIQRTNLRFALRRAGYCVQTASGPDQALDIAGWFHPQILITDWMLDSECDGRMLARLLQETDPTLKTIVITAYPRYELEDDCDGWAQDPVIEKPFSIDELLESVCLLSRERTEPSELITTQPSVGTFTFASA